MTIELSLRRRSTQARCFASLWLILATLILIGTYLSLPYIAHKTLNYVSQIEGQFPVPTGGATIGDLKTKTFLQMEVVTLVTLVLGLFAVSFACFLLGRSAFVEIELAARYSGLADALCIAGDNFERLEKAAALLVPKAKEFSIPEMFLPKDREAFVELLKLLRKG